MLLAADKGRPGQRYVLSGTNLDSRTLQKEVAAVAGFEPPGWHIHLPAWLLRPVFAVVNLISRLRGGGQAVSPALLELWGRHAWYDTRKAREELGWEPRPLQASLRDTLAWLQRADGAAKAAQSE